MSPPADAGQLVYLEPDDEITSVVRRLREAEAGRVVLVAPARSKVTSSAVAMRLLAGIAEDEGREIALVADLSGRALAAEAGIAAFASVGEASGEGAAPAEAAPAPRAPIHVVRGGAATGTDAAIAAAAAASAAGPGDETQTVAVAPPPRATTRPAGRQTAAWLGMRTMKVLVALGVAAVLLASAAVAAVAPAATIVIRPLSVPIEPATYVLLLSPDGEDAGQLTATAQGTASGVYTDPVPASGTATFFNYTYVTVEVPQGTRVSAGGEVFFATTQRVIAPPGDLGLGGIEPGQISVGVVAEEPGPGGNVAAEAIDRIENRNVDRFLQGFAAQTGRRVLNREPITGGDDNRAPEVTQADVSAAVAEIQADLGAQLRDRLVEEEGRVYAPAAGGEPVIDVPDDLVGRRGEESFTLDGTLAYRRAYVELDSVTAAAGERLMADGSAAPRNAELLPDTIEVQVDEISEAGEQLRIEVTVTGDAVPMVDAEAIREMVPGMTGAQAREALDEIGDVSVELWPGWVDRVPQLPWRIDVQVEASR